MGLIISSEGMHDKTHYDGQPTPSNRLFDVIVAM